jgi:hypothetical protein
MLTRFSDGRIQFTHHAAIFRRCIASALHPAIELQLILIGLGLGELALDDSVLAFVEFPGLRCQFPLRSLIFSASLSIASVCSAILRMVSRRAASRTRSALSRASWASSCRSTQRAPGGGPYRGAL